MSMIHKIDLPRELGLLGCSSRAKWLCFARRAEFSTAWKKSFHGVENGGCESRTASKRTEQVAK